MRVGIRNCLIEMRVQHYVKNTILFFPVFFSGALFTYKNWFPLIWGFISFSFCTSFVYIINDIQDIEKDKKHVKKRKRPIAAGLISVSSAKKLGFTLIVTSFFSLLCAIKSGAGFISLYILFAYLALNVVYSIFHLKDIALLDVVILASGFILRLMFGSALANISVSTWLYLVVLSGSFYLGFGKRRNEMRTQSNTRKVLEVYSEKYLSMSMYSCMSLTIVFFALWCIEKEQGNSLFDYLWFVAIIMIIFFKYNLDLEQPKYTGDPMEIFLEDHVIQAMCVVTGILMFLNIYN